MSGTMTRRQARVTNTTIQPPASPGDLPVPPTGVGTRGGGGGPPEPQGGGGGAPLPVVGAPEPPPPQEIIFALVPAQAQQNVIDYSTREGMSLYREATTSLYPAQAERFSCEADELENFITLVGDRMRGMGYVNLLMITDRASVPNVSRNFMENYGDIPLEDVTVTVGTYLHTQTRLAQESTQLYYCLRNSLSEAGLARVSVFEDTYIINGIPAGMVFLKVIIAESDVDTYATATYIRNQLASLDEYMETVSSDITKFNLHVKTLIKALRRRRQESHDVLTNLFKGYMAASDKPFVEYIERKQEDHEEGIPLNPDHLMTLAANKYKIRVRRGQWCQPSESEAQLLALQTEVRILKARRDKSRSTGKSDKEKAAEKAEKAKKRKQKERETRPTWMTTPPTEAEKGKKKVNDGKDYYWCEPLQVWARHKPEDCRMAKKASDATKKAIKMRQALSSVMDEYDIEDEEDDDDGDQEDE